MKPLVTLAVTLTILLIVSGIVMFFAQGYRIDIGNRNLEQTGILTVNSLPEGALIFLNEIPQDVTDNSIQGLKPGTYDLRLEKEGYQSWTRTVEISVGRVTQHTALLISLFPEIKPLTLTGVNNPQVSLDGQKIVYTTSQAQNNLPTQSGVWLLELTSRPFNIASRPTLLLTDTPTLPYSAAKISWGGDNQSLVLEMPDGEIFLYDLQAGQTRPLSPENKLILEEDWAQLAKRNEELLREQFDSEIRKELPGQETGGVWSPDQTKILYTQLKDGMREYNQWKISNAMFPIQKNRNRMLPYFGMPTVCICLLLKHQENHKVQLVYLSWTGKIKRLFITEGSLINMYSHTLMATKSLSIRTLPPTKLRVIYIPSRLINLANELLE